MAEAAVPRKRKKFKKPTDLRSRHVYTPDEVRYGRVFDPDPYSKGMPFSYRRTRPYGYMKALVDYYDQFLENLRGLGNNNQRR